MDILLKTNTVIKIISLIPRAFHATQLSLNGAGRLMDIKMYFSDSSRDFETAQLPNLAYIQFKPDPNKRKDQFKPVYNSLDKAYDYCFIDIGKEPGALEAVMHYEGM